MGSQVEPPETAEESERKRDKFAEFLYAPSPRIMPHLPSPPSP